MSPTKTILILAATVLALMALLWVFHGEPVCIADPPAFLSGTHADCGVR